MATRASQASTLGTLVTDVSAYLAAGEGNPYQARQASVELDGVVLFGHRANSAVFSCAARFASDSGITISVLANADGVVVTPFVLCCAAA